MYYLLRFRGFTTIELLSTLLIISVVSAMAAPSFLELIAKQRTKTAASELYFSLIKTRSEALKRNANIVLTPISNDWRNGWEMRDANNTVLDSHSALTGVTVSSEVQSITYQNSGRILGTTSPSFIISVNGSSAYSCVMANLNGRPYFKGSQSC